MSYKNSESLNLPAEGFARLPQVIHATGLGRTKIYEMMKTGEFPKSVKLGARLVAWRVNDIRSWIEKMST